MTGLKVVEVSHDMNKSVSKIVCELKLQNFYDTWHGT